MSYPRPITDHSRLSINTATTRVQWNLSQAIDGYARAGVGGISPWRDQIAEMGLAKAAKAIKEADLTVSGVCRGGMFPWSDAQGRVAMLDDNRQAIEEAATLNAQCLVLVVGGLPAGSKDLAGAHAMVEEAISVLLPEARAAGVPLAIEPLHPMYAADRACVNTMRHALDICERAGEGIGVAVDVYHVWWDTELQSQIKRAGKERLLAFHICDWLVPTRDLLTDRGMMGDGVIDIPLLRGWVEEAGFDGLNEVEIFSELDWWKRDPEEVVKICKERSLTVV
ncbi:sugar phosphate isomerase/epimerase family protein [Sneathiella litorea]|uniref:TIM barrel protein n=1 Tax=Sneathiella litorea TaxID=2606216 RepID=A0A6L8WB75_9PROT|nr:sugar phosphate isomerase/epimerase family protein [Sneathiella litorea]MZR32295.1 TIM barrel protein [Sneathiella litorea]